MSVAIVVRLWLAVMTKIFSKHSWYKIDNTSIAWSPPFATHIQVVYTVVHSSSCSEQDRLHSPHQAVFLSVKSVISHPTHWYIMCVTTRLVTPAVLTYFAGYPYDAA